MIDYDNLERRADDLQKEFSTGTPYPHVVIDGFFRSEAAQHIHDALLEIDAGFITRRHLHSHKYTNPDWRTFPQAVAAAFQELHSERFLGILSRITRLPKLYSDPDLFGGGVHISVRGGFLDVHADFTDHPTLKKRRALNALVYLNPEWKPEYKGHLEMWSADMRRCVKKVAPDFNRCVIFATSLTSYHGHPETLACPESVSRKSLAVYYYCDWASADEPRLVTTDYRPRPWDYRKRLRKAVRRALGERISGWIRPLLRSR